MGAERRPPRWGVWLIRLLVPAEFREELTGDLLERYSARRLQGVWRATVWFAGQLLRLRPLGLRRAARAVRATDHYRTNDGEGGMAVWNGWGKDVRQSMRSLRTRFGFSATVVVTVALAVGATTSVFSVVNGVLLKPLDFPEPDRLVRVWQTRPGWADHSNAQLRAFAERFPLSVPTFNDWLAARTGLESLGIYTGEQWVHQSPEGAEIMRGLLVTSGVFEALGVPAAIGRHLIPEDDAVGAPGVVVLSYGFWQDRFGGDPSLVGQSLSLDGAPYVVVGVMPEGFTVPGSGGSAWSSLPEEEKLGDRDSQSYTVLARLRPGATVESAQADLELVQANLSEIYEEQGDMRARVVGLLDSMVGDVRSTLFFLLAAVGLVLLIACVNIANMLSINGLARRRELAVKAALGASRGQLVRALLTESAVLASLGGLAGILLTLVALPLLGDLLPSTLPRADSVAMDARVLVFGLLVTASTAILVGVLPAMQAAATQPKQMMDASARGLAGGKAGERVRSGLVVTEVALSFVLLVGATLLATSYSRLWTVDRGFSTTGLIEMHAVPNPVDFPESEDQARFRAELHQRLLEIPGTRVSMTNQVPLAGSTSTTTYYVDMADGSQEEANVMISVVGEDYFDVMGIALLAGRPLTRADASDAPLVGIVNQELADRYWPGESPIGKQLRSDRTADPTTVVGLANNVRHQGLQADPEPKLYVPVEQNRRAANHWVIRVDRGEPSSVIELARAAVTAVSPSTPVRDFQILEERIASSVSVPRFRTLFVIGLAGMATILALLGVYGVVAFAVSQRTRELAVRMAIGAHPRDVVTDTLRRGARLSVLGMAVGLVIAWQSTRLLDEFLFDVDATSPFVYLMVGTLVGAVSLAASWVPARRASRVDPVTVLNSE